MKRLMMVTVLAVLLSFVIYNAKQAESEPGGPSNKPNPPSHVCYAFASFPDDFLMLSISPGQNLVTGVYRQCPADMGSADALMAGTIQDVPVGNTLPSDPFNSAVRTQISLTGSIASGILPGGEALDKASHCWSHLVFEDNNMSTGEFIGACEWFTPPRRTYNAGDRFNDQIDQIACDDVIEAVGNCIFND